MRLTGRTARILLGPIKDAEKVADGSAAKWGGGVGRAHAANPMAATKAAALIGTWESAIMRDA